MRQHKGQTGGFVAEILAILSACADELCYQYG